MSRLQITLGQTLRRIRLAQGLTQAALATAIGRSTDLISRIERGESAPSFETLEALSTALQTPPEALFGGTPGAAGRSPALDELVASMDDAELAWAVDMLRQARRRPR